MTDNIYLELELFLDPAITDPAALRQELDAKIKQWNKQVNANPKFGTRVSKAKEYLKGGLPNLTNQANDARNEKLNELRAAIGNIKLTREIGDEERRRLKDTFKLYLSERTIEQEAGGVVTVIPVCPASLQCEKPVSFSEMLSIHEDLQRVKNGQYKDVYELLELPRSTPTDQLLAKTKEESARILRIAKKDDDTNARNRLIGKPLLFFKDDTARRGYDIALKRFPFDLLCKDVFTWRVSKDDITDAYYLSISETVSKGFTREEAEWLVYEYYCVNKQCPPPKPEPTKKSQAPTPTSSAPPVFDVVKGWARAAQSVAQSAVQSASTRLKPTDSAPTPTQSVAPTAQPENVVTKGWQWFSAMMHTKHEPLATHTEVGQFDALRVEDLRRELQGIKKQYQSPTADLVLIFDQLDSIYTAYKSSLPQAMSEVLRLRAEVGKKLGDESYAQQQLGVALRCYKTVLEHRPHDVIAARRAKEVDDFKISTFAKIETLMTQESYAECVPLFHELQTKLANDPETTDVIKAFRTKIETTGIPTKLLQALKDDKKWQTIDDLLEVSPVSVQTRFADFRLNVRKRIAEADKGADKIREAIQAGQIGKAKQMFAQLGNFIADHRDSDVLESEVEGTLDQASKTNHEITILCKKKHWVRAENVLRRFLVANPIKVVGLVPIVQNVSAGVANFENWLRFLLFAVVGGVLFLATAVMCSSLLQSQSGEPSLGTNAFYTIGCLIASWGVFAVLIRFIRNPLETPPAMSWASLVGVFLVMVGMVCVHSYVARAETKLGLEAWVQGIYERRVEQIRSDSSNDYESREAKVKYEEQRCETHKNIIVFVLPIGICVAFGFYCYAWQSFLYANIRRCIGSENRAPSFLLFVSSFLFLPVVVYFVISPDKLYAVTGQSIFLIALWVTACLVVFTDHRKELDTSFGKEDFRDYWQRRQLLASLRDSDFGAASLLETRWYSEVDMKYRVAINKKPPTVPDKPSVQPNQSQSQPVQQSNATTQPAQPQPPPQPQKVPVPRTVPVPPLAKR